MANKLRTGFELPFSNIGSNTYKDIISTDSYVSNGLFDGSFQVTSGTQHESSINKTALSFRFKYNTSGRSLQNTRGTYAEAATSAFLPSINISKVSLGLYCNFYFRPSIASNIFQKYIYLDDGSDRYFGYIDNSGTNTVAKISKNGVDVASQDIGSKLVSSTWYNCLTSVNNAGLITLQINGATAVTYASSVTFSSWTKLGIAQCDAPYQGIDDIAINDGSGASDNTTPNSIKAFNFFDSATLNSNSGFSQVGGSGVLANLQDGDDATRVSAEADLSNLDFSLPSLSGSGMSETTSNFSGIEGINVYARQIEATKANSVLKAKVTDVTSSANREETIALPLTVSNNSVTMENDGASDWSLANLDAGNMDLKITFDKP
jgi:hypothetical protein